jgi:adenylate cyclase
MPEPWLIQVFDHNQLVHSCTCTGRVELGRQGHVGETIYATSDSTIDNVSRVVIAGPNEDRVSRKHALLEPLPGARLKVENRSRKAPIGLGDGSCLQPGETRELSLPALLILGHKVVKVQEAYRDEFGASLQGLEQQTIGPRAAAQGLTPATGLASFRLPVTEGIPGEPVLRCLQATLEVLKSAATDTEFFQKAAQAVVEGVGLDTGRVLVLEGNTWKTIAYETSPDVDDLRGRPPSQGVLDRVRREARTFWHSPSMATSEDGSSLVGITSVVAAPILDAEDRVIAVLYGDRRQFPALPGAQKIGRLEAVLVDLLAGSVAAGLARLDQQRAALAIQTQFEQFFTPELARQLASRPDLLTGQDLEITVLFCDIRGFSRITRSLGPARTLEWIGDVLSTLSDCVLDRQGVLVDYIGDELMAMWGAPEAQPDHAERACLAALDMLGRLPELNARWQPILGEPMGLGIGLNTGTARVGNIGSKRKFKYGPLGDTVNVASRVQGANKYFKSNLLLTRATRDRLGPQFRTRRLGSVRVVNIADPIELHELAPLTQPGWPELCAAYERALAAFEGRNFRQAARILGSLVEEHVEDGPSLALMSRAVGFMVEEPDPDEFDPSYRLPGK